MRTFVKASAALAVVFLAGALLHAQVGTGGFVGTIHDASGAAVAGANVTVTNVDNGISRALVSDAGGRYSVPGLMPGNYEIQAQSPGFQTAIRRGIQLTVGSELAVDLVLQVGQITQIAVVTADAPLVDTVTSSVSGLVAEKTIVDLPLNGRSFDQLIDLQSGVMQLRARGGSVQHGTGSHFSVAGARGVSNVYLLDGTEMVGGAATSSMPGGAFGANLGVEAVQEFQILTSNYTAVYGKKAGGVVNVATRSGTNAIHGSVYAFHRNDNLDAANWADSARCGTCATKGIGIKPEFKRNQFGAALGGPIRKDSTFFFGNYEGLRERLGLTGSIIVPDDNARRGVLPTETVVLAPSIPAFLEALFPRVNGQVFGDGTGEYSAAQSQSSDQDFFLGRVDHKVSDNDFLFVRYNLSDSRRLIPSTNGVIAGVREGREQMATVEWKRTGATLVNSARIGFSRGSTLTDDQPIVDLDPSLNFLDGAETVGQITFGAASAEGLTSLSGAGTGNSSDRWFVQNQFQVADQVYYQLGAHALQFGGDLQRIQNNYDYATSKRGEFEFPGLKQFLLGTPARFSAPDPRGSADATKAYRRWYVGTYVQDDWRVRSNLTLNLGLRYETTTVPTEASGDRISNFHYIMVNGWKTLEDQPRLGSPYWESKWLTFAPRVGFAWDPAGTGVTSIRGGFGMFYDQIEGEYRAFTQNNVPFFGLLRTDNPPFPKGFAVVAGTNPVPAPDSLAFDFDIPTRQSWNLSVQRQLTGNVAVSATYVGSQSFHLTRRSEGNGRTYQLQADGSKFYPSNFPRRNPRLGANRAIESDVNASYHGLSFDLNQRVDRGLQYKVSYTFAKNIDYASSPNGAQNPGSTDTSQDPMNVRADRGLASMHVGHSFKANSSYDLPGASMAGVAGHILGGWRLGSILTIQEGTPFTVTTGFSRSRDQTRAPADRPNLVSGASNNPVEGVTGGCGTAREGTLAGRELGTPDLYFDPCVFVLPELGTYGNLGRNTVMAPGLINVDVNLEKGFRFGETKILNFRTEIFNLFNRANFGLPDATPWDSSGSGARRNPVGRINDTVTTSRQLQFALKFVF